MKVIFATLFVGWLVSLSALGQEKEAKVADPFAAGAKDGTPKNISVQLEYIEMSHKDLTRLLMEYKPTSSDATVLRKKVQEAVDKDQAKVIETQLISSKADRRASAQSFNEFVYPIEYEPPGGLLNEEMLKADEYPFIMALPSGFETRNVGSSLEAEPFLTSDSKMIDVKFISKYLWHSGDNIWHESKDSEGNVCKTTTPNFYLIDIDTSATVVSGQFFLAGVVSPKDVKGQVDSERKVMAFLKCDALPVVP